MQRETAKLLHDVAEVCREIELVSAGETQTTVLGNRTLQLALQKLIENVGEGLGRINRVDAEMAGQIPNLRQYMDMRNRTAHGYDSIDYSIVWKVAQEQISNLLSAVNLLLEQAPVLVGQRGTNQISQSPFEHGQ